MELNLTVKSEFWMSPYVAWKALPPDASHASVIDRSPKVRTPDQGVRDLEVPAFQMPADR